MPYANGKPLLYPALCFAKIWTVREKLKVDSYTTLIGLYCCITVKSNKQNSLKRRHQIVDGDTDTRQTDGNRRMLFSYSRGHETSRKCKSGHSTNGLDYYTSLAYAREVKIW